MVKYFLLLLLVALTVGLFVKQYQRLSPSPPKIPRFETNLPTNQPVVISPKSGDTITGPLVIKGYIPKSWTFEGQFQMKLLDSQRRIIIQDRVPVEWDNENKKDTLYFVESYNYHTSATSGFLVLENDNPSGLPEKQKNIEILVNFSKPPPDTVYLFLYNPEEDKKICDCVACQVVLPEPVKIAHTETPIKDTLNLLAKKMHPDFYVKSLNLKNNILTIEFPVIDSFTSGGSCIQGINLLQVVKTAKQFPEVKFGKVIPDEIFQP